LCASISRGVSLTKIWRLVSPTATSAGDLVWAFSLDGTKVLRGRALADAMNCNFASIYAGDLGVPPSGIQPVYSTLSSSLQEPFSIDEYVASLAKCRDGAPGIDGVRYQDMRRLGEDARISLLKYFNNLWVSGLMPQAWSFAILVPVTKAGKDRSCLRSYRPIALLSCVRKVFERMVCSRLTWFLEASNALHCAQFGFRASRGPQDAVLLLENGVREAWANGMVLLAVFLDVKAAYDTVPLEWVFAELRGLGIPEQLVQVLRSLLLQRSFVTRVGSHYSNVQSTDRGLPQGSCLSPILFVVFLNSLLHVVSKSANVAAFADDVGLWVVGTSLNDVVDAMQSAICLVEEWLGQRGMGLTPGKSQAVLFTPHATPGVVLHVSGQRVTSTDTVRYLGVTLDAQLSWGPEARGVRSMVQNITRVLLRLVGRENTCKRRALRPIFHALVQSRLDYHLPFLCGVPLKLRGIQVEVNVGLRAILGCMESTPVSALHVEAGVLPQEWRARGILIKLILRGLGRGGNDLVARILTDYLGLGVRTLSSLGIVGLGIKLVLEAGIRRFPIGSFMSKVGPWLWAPLASGCISTLSCVPKCKAPTEPHCYDGELSIYCDASFEARSYTGGVGVYIPEFKLGLSRRLPSVPSNMLAELEGISVALDLGLDLGVPRFVVWSDSQAALKVVASRLHHQEGG